MRTYFWIISIFLVIMGIMGAVPALDLGAEPFWHAILKIVLGVVGMIFLIRTRE